MSSAVISPFEETVLHDLDITPSSTSTLESSPKYSPPVLSVPGTVNLELLNKQLTKIQTSITDGTAQIMAKLASMNMKGGAFNPNANSRMKGGGLFDGVLGSSNSSSTIPPRASSNRNPVGLPGPAGSAGLPGPVGPAPTFANRFKSLFGMGASAGPTGAAGPTQALRPSLRPVVKPTGLVKPAPLRANTSNSGYSSTGGYRRRSTRKQKRSGKKSRRSSRK